MLQLFHNLIYFFVKFQIALAIPALKRQNEAKIINKFVFLFWLVNMVMKINVKMSTDWNCVSFYGIS